MRKLILAFAFVQAVILAPFFAALAATNPTDTNGTALGTPKRFQPNSVPARVNIQPKPEVNVEDGSSNGEAIAATSPVRQPGHYCYRSGQSMDIVSAYDSIVDCCSYLHGAYLPANSYLWIEVATTQRNTAAICLFESFERGLTMNFDVCASGMMSIYSRCARYFNGNELSRGGEAYQYFPSFLTHLQMRWDPNVA